jgi:hypothetical protein
MQWAKPLTVAIAASFIVGLGITWRCVTAADPPAGPTTCPAAGMEMKAPATNAAMQALQGLSGTWVSTDPVKEGDKPRKLIFKSVAKDSAVMEVMFPGSDEEMIDMYTVDGQGVALTHYCAMGNQPHMRAKGIENGVLKFEYVGGGNIKNREDPHMDAVEITIQGDRLTENWTFYQGGQTKQAKFEFKRQAP